MKIFYKTSATATGGRDGRTQVDDGSIGFDLVSFQNESGKHGAFGLDLDITITVAGLTEDEARKLITRAHEVCPYSNATRGNVDVRLHVNVIQSFDL